MPVTFIPKSPVICENYSTGKIFEDCTLVSFEKKVKMSITIPRGVAAGQTITLHYDTDDLNYKTTWNGNLFRASNPTFTAIES
tara:strand:- start:37122 stop:37370 length:249 start_codon:yes stop_codon:yes gene_type:complete